MPDGGLRHKHPRGSGNRSLACIDLTAASHRHACSGSRRNAHCRQRGMPAQKAAWRARAAVATHASDARPRRCCAIVGGQHPRVRCRTAMTRASPLLANTALKRAHIVKPVSVICSVCVFLSCTWQPAQCHALIPWQHHTSTRVATTGATRIAGSVTRLRNGSDSSKRWQTATVLCAFRHASPALAMPARGCPRKPSARDQRTEQETDAKQMLSPGHQTNRSASYVNPTPRLEFGQNANQPTTMRTGSTLAWAARQQQLSFKTATGVVQHKPSSAPAASARGHPRLPRDGAH